MIDAAGRWFAEWKAQRFKKKNQMKISKNTLDACVLRICCKAKNLKKKQQQKTLLLAFSLLQESYSSLLTHDYNTQICTQTHDRLKFILK